MVDDDDETNDASEATTDDTTERYEELEGNETGDERRVRGEAAAPLHSLGAPVVFRSAWSRRRS